MLGPPDGQVLYDECLAYEELIENLGALPIGGISYDAMRWPHLQEATAVWLLKLDGSWIKTSAKPTLTSLVLPEDSCEIDGGMSGSPIVAANGAAVGVVSTNAGWWTSRLTANLPGWLLQKAHVEQKRKEGKRK